MKKTKLFFFSQPFIGFRLTHGNLPFKITTVNGTNHHEFQCMDDHEVQLDQVITAPMPNLTLDISIRGEIFYLQL